MIEALGAVDSETTLVIDLLSDAVARYAHGGFPEGFRWGDVPQHCGTGPGRSNTMLRREEEARQISHTHAWWVRQRDHLFHALDDWRGAIGRVRDLIPRVAKWTDNPGQPAIEVWSAQLRQEVSELEGVHDRIQEGPVPLLEADKVPRLTAAIAKLRRRGEDLRNIVVCPALPLPVDRALAALEVRDNWTLEDLPAGITDDLLRVLDADGMILLRARWWQNTQRYPGDPSPPVLSGGDWVSPGAQPRVIGTWEVLFRDRDTCKDLSPQLKLSPTGKAQVARARLQAAATPVAIDAGGNKVKKRRKRKAPLNLPARPLTPLEVKTLEVVGRHKQNFTAAAAELQRDPKTVRENYVRALAKANRITGHNSRSVDASALPTDRRGQVNI